MVKIRRLLPSYVFLIPALILFSLFRAWPLVQGFMLSFQEVNVVSGNTWIGLDNFRALSKSAAFLRSLRITIAYTVTSVPLMVLIALFLAILLNVDGLRLRTFFRAAIFMPYVTSGVVVSIIWKWFFNQTYGLVNIVLGLFRIPPQRWLTSPRLALLCIMFVILWKLCGLFMLIFLANLQLIDPHLYEAASIDGANAWQRFRYITLNQLRPSFVITVILSTIFFFRAFEVVYNMTGGDPGGATDLLAFHIFQLAFQSFDFGRASAGIVVMLLIVAVALAMQLKLTEVSA
jgi:multiple sugar transport system permease protein